jgi:pimeloyl-ACP methyl ester carboxylesterase
VPPAALDPVLFSDYEQLKRFFYLFLFRDPAGFADGLVASDGMAFLGKLWREWSPGYQHDEDLARVKESLRAPANLAAAIGYYRAVGAASPPVSSEPASAPGSAGTASTPGSAGAARYAAEEQAAGRQAPQPTLYLHGASDGCIRVELARGAQRLLAPSSRMVVIEEAGHFLQVEKPGQVNEHILGWVTG